MKKIFALVLAAIMTISLASCGDSSKNDESVVTTTKTETTTNSSVQSSQQSSEEIITPSLQSVEFNNNLAICNNTDDENEPTFAIISTDGTVKTKGNNKYGQLGVGDIDNHKDWQTIDSLKNIKQVSSSEISTIFLALNSSGELYYWGGLNSNPQRIDFDKKITKLCPYAIETEQGEFYYVHFQNDGDRRRFSFATILSLNYPKDAIAGNGGYVYNGKYYDVDLDANKKDSFGKVTSESSENNIAYICDYGCCITDNGSAINYIPNKTIINETNLKKYLCRNNTEYFLFNDGTLKALGENKNGQLGDGTTYASKSQLTILPNVKDICAESYYVTAYALTNDNALYAWGKKYSSTPTPIITPQDFY